MVSIFILQSINLHKRLIHRVSTNINNTVNQCNKNIDKKENNRYSGINKSIKFSDYNVIYSFPQIKYFNAANIVKRNQTIFNGALVPITIGLLMMDIITTDNVLAILLSSSVFTFGLHISAWFWNNLIGFVYFNEADKTVILSYSNYWGKRIDLNTNLMNIIPLSKCPLNINSRLYRILNIKSCKQKLKLSTKYGHIHDKPDFEHLFGIPNNKLY